MKIKYPHLPIVFLMGPTASGKTALAIELYQTGLFEIISVDSAMVYRQLDIGSAKPSDEELKLAPHYLIDIIEPIERYSAADFAHDASELINQIHQKNKVPLLVGGTMLYFKALKDGLADLPASDEKVREQLANDLAEKGIEQLHAQLCQVDPVTAERLHTTDTQRIMRALEVFKISGKPLSQFHQEQSLQSLPNPVLSVALAPQDRSVLHQRIKLRFEQMINTGFVDEVKQLLQTFDLKEDSPAMKSVGYRQILQFLKGELTLDAAVERAIIATRQLAKRQYTWLRSWPELNWFDPLDNEGRQQAFKAIVDFSKSKMDSA